jgi:hypothetical protein
MKPFLTGIAAVFMLGCSPNSTASTSPSATTSPSPPSLQVSNGDAYHTINVPLGQELRVTLKENPGFETWAVPTSTDHTVLVQANVKENAPQGTTVATFRATKKGAAKLQSIANVHCTPGAACSHLVMGWSITTNVT